MDYAQILHELETASVFDLWRLKIAIGKMIDDPKRHRGIKAQLRVGKVIQYFEADQNRLIDAEIVEVKRTRTLVKNINDGGLWNIPFYMINIEGADTDIHVNRESGKLDRNNLKVGDHVGWISSRTGQEMYGEVTKLNPKKARVLVENQHTWTVSYSLLFPVMDGNTAQEGLLIEGTVI